MENLSPIKDVSHKEAQTIKLCCADFYQQDVVKFFLGTSLHPGGLGLTRQIAETLKISSKSHLLDIACGEGSSAVFIASTFGCTVTGTDISQKGISAAQNKLNSLSSQAAQKVQFIVTDSECLPFEDASFDFAITECAFSTFGDKEKSATEIYRVLKPGGQWASSDMLVKQDHLPSSMKSLLFQSGCIAMAENLTGYANYMRKLNFTITFVEDTSWALEALIQEVEKRLLATKLLIGISNLPVTANDLQRVEELIEQGKALLNKKIIGYGYIIGKKCSP